MNIFGKGMGHTAVSVTCASSVILKIWQHVVKDNQYCNVATFNSLVVAKTSIIQMGPTSLTVGQKNEPMVIYD